MAFFSQRTLHPIDVFSRLTAVFSVPADQLPEFPIRPWQRWRAICQERWNFFTGQALYEEITQNGKTTGEKYPLHINPIKSFSLKHTYVLFGEVPDGADSIVQCKVLPRSVSTPDGEGPAEADKQLALEAEQATQELYYENNMRALMLENGLLAQFLGGCVFKIGWALPTLSRPTGIKIERVIPDYFWGEEDGSDFWNLRRAWVVQPIKARVAKDTYGVDIGGDPDAEVLMLEYWDRQSYRVTIEGKVASVESGDLGRVPMEGANEYGFVPFVYIPHERAGEFHGLSIVDAIKDLELEYNARMADAGDSVRDQSQLRPWIANVSGSVRRREIFPGLQALDLGSSTPEGNKPEAGVIEPPGISAEMNHFNTILFDQMRRDGFVPPVADGEDEGSQRSALTLAFRMWPLTSHIRAERQYWTEGLNLLAEMGLAILAVKNPQRLSPAPEGLAAAVIERKHLGHRKRQVWAPMIPRDREQLVNEMILRAQTDHASPEHALEVYGDIDDIQAELGRIEDWAKKRAAWLQAQKPAKTDVATPAAATFTE